MKHIFNAGPALLPDNVKEEGIQAIKNFDHTGVSVLELGHRSKEVEHFFAEAEQNCLDLLSLKADDYAVLFLSGGASTQFFQIPFNFLANNESASYFDTGYFANKAIKAAQDFGRVNIVASSKDKNYSYLPKNFNISQQDMYLHLTSNNTIFGTQWKNYPQADIPIIADMTSDFLSRDIDYSKFSMMYAGAQKNAGIAGCTIVVIKKSFLRQVQRKIPAILSYKQQIENKSMVNTPPVFAVYITHLFLKWTQVQGGVKKMDSLSKQRAELIYNTIDRSIFKGTTAKEDRSLMNACFVPADEKHSDIIEKEFSELCKKNDIVGIKGHRSVGGFRASMYNALSIESVKILCEVIKDFSLRKG